jgi:hypothetical protein
MTVNSTNRVAGPFTGNSVQVAFPFTFKVFLTSEVYVALTNTVLGYATVLTLNTDYTVTLNSNQNSNPGGTVTLLAAPSSSYTVTLTSQLPNTQPSDLTNAGAFYPQTVNDSFDRATIQIQQLQTSVGSSLRLPLTAPAGTSLQLPLPVSNKLLGWNAAATALENKDLTITTASGATVSSFSLLSSTVAVLNQVIDTAGYSIAGLGKSQYIAKAGSVATVNGIQTNSATGGLYWYKVNYWELRGYDVGALEDGTTDDSSALQTAAQNSNIVKLDAVTKAPNATLDLTANTTFIGDNNFIYPKPYRKVVVPKSATSDTLTSVDVNPRKHLKQANIVAKPVVVLMGDSLTTYLANSWGRADTLAETLHRTLESQFPNGVTFYDRGISGSVYGSSQTIMYSANIPWYAGLSGTTWIDVVKALNPDLIILSWGMNDSSSIKTVDVKNLLDYIQGWAKVPSIVMASCLVPSPRALSNPVGSGATQEGRDNAAGFVRSYAKFRNVGLLDLHRKFCMVRDGFDPCSSIMTNNSEGVTAPIVINTVLNHSLGSRKVYDYRAQLQIDGNLVSASKGLAIKVGPGGNDFCQILKPSGTQLQLNMYSGSSDAIGYTSKIITYTLPATTDWLLTIEKVGNFLAIYYDNDSQFGTYNEPIFFEKCVSLGGEYTPEISSDGTASVYILKNVVFFYGTVKANLPSVTDALMFGNESGTNAYGGSGFNHPGGAIATHVYRPVIEGTCWTADIALEGTQAIGSGVTSQVVTFVTQELTTNYRVNLTEAAAGATSVGQRFWYGTKTISGFTIYFAAATAAAGNIDWRLERY